MDLTELDRYLDSFPLYGRVLFFLGVALVAHGLVWLVRQTSARIIDRGHRRKLRSVNTLATSCLVFLIYFATLGFILAEFGVSLMAYFASASVLGLALGFGSQGLVQDVVMGLTFVVSDLLDVDDLIEVGGQVGKVKSITLRFIELENALGARIYIPNRTVNNVINYPKGYIRCLVDVTLLGSEQDKTELIKIIERHMRGLYDQFPGILLSQPSIEGRQQTEAGKDFLRVKFRIWPNRGQPIEVTFTKELLSAIRVLMPDYQDWMVAVYYEVEDKV